MMVIARAYARALSTAVKIIRVDNGHILTGTDSYVSNLPLFPLLFGGVVGYCI